jgi:hypothetical protein
MMELVKDQNSATMREPYASMLTYAIHLHAKEKEKEEKEKKGGRL